MSKAHRQPVDVNVPPARARAPRFPKSRMAFRGLLLVLVGLGIWKAYELIVALLTLYNEHKKTVDVVAVMTVVAIIVLGLWLMVRARRVDAAAQRPLPFDEPTADNTTTSQATAQRATTDDVAPSDERAPRA